ncbi:hypothetical protein E8L90_01610 [Brevibacillus antibioticus]|uniref:Uncharacterized protein n=1 Tax=Brevibacillus antibioticus TaxID=2570228 RepID=A0A4U2Y1I0_9BACL|nr:hypothetical protein E8L90_01610 [Brevibacillus antibioticus]
MQKAKHALKRPPLKHILKGRLWTRFRFLHGVGQSNPQRVGQEAERFLLFPRHHYRTFTLFIPFKFLHSRSSYVHETKTWRRSSG